MYELSRHMGNTEVTSLARMLCGSGTMERGLTGLLGSSDFDDPGWIGGEKA